MKRIDTYISEKLHINKDVKVLNIPLYSILTAESSKFPLELDTPINFEIIDYDNKSKKCVATYCNRIGETNYAYVFYNENGPLFTLTPSRLTELLKGKSIDNVYLNNIGRVTLKLLEE